MSGAKGGATGKNVTKFNKYKYKSNSCYESRFGYEEQKLSWLQKEAEKKGRL
jgi:hypothetical protein